MLVEQIINGIVLGSMNALIAQGDTLVFGVLDKLNFAHSEIFMLGGFLSMASMARLMGGEAGVESEAGGGSRFWFRIRAGLSVLADSPPQQ